MPTGDTRSDLRKSTIPQGGTVHRTFTADPAAQALAAPSLPPGGHRLPLSAPCRWAMQILRAISSHAPHAHRKPSAGDFTVNQRTPTYHSPGHRPKTSHRAPRHRLPSPRVRHPPPPATPGASCFLRTPSCPPTKPRPASPPTTAASRLSSATDSARPSTPSSTTYASDASALASASSAYNGQSGSTSSPGPWASAPQDVPRGNTGPNSAPETAVWHRIGTHSILDRPLAEGHRAGRGRRLAG